jgi:hypothetical protein
MSDKPTRPQPADGRQARLRDALRENLKRRKLQARGRATTPDEWAAVDVAPGEPATGDEAIVQDTRRNAADDAT